MPQNKHREGGVLNLKCDWKGARTGLPVASPVVFAAHIVAVVAHLDNKVDCSVLVVKLKVLHVVPAVHSWNVQVAA